MIEENYAKKQIMRLTGLSFFPTTPEAIREMVGALAIAPTDQVAKSTVDHFLANVTECPKPCEIRERAQPAAAAIENPPMSATRCNACSDTGWRRGWVERRGNKYEIAVECKCRKVTA